jgi:glutathione-specific gamma-glutamylcyclotransferase
VPAAFAFADRRRRRGPLPGTAAQVRASHGPSGSNQEYVLRLAEALAAIGAEDEHIAAVAQLLR